MDVPTRRSIEVHGGPVRRDQDPGAVRLSGVRHPVGWVVDVFDVNDGDVMPFTDGPCLNHRLAFIGRPGVVRFPTGL